eukprot:GGOE01005851.1.p1 GENE.GGOE01005851.1~~GGOE01005851.1.p1  ORF type:complete len:759 (-),score=188.25 GGOE01005851.1:447-2723(-)
MATNPGLLYHFPWEGAGGLKYLLLLPLALHHVVGGWSDPVQGRFDDHLLLIVALRYIQMFLWQFAARFDRISQKTRIQRKGIEFEQLDRERNWDEYIITQAIGTSLIHRYVAGFRNFPVVDWMGVVIMLLTHIGPIEFIYYWFHRALHHGFLWSGYHSHHHSSFVTDPVTGTVHPFLEQMCYNLLFFNAVAIPWYFGTCSLSLLYIYAVGFDFANAMGHCNFEFMPRAFIRAPLKYLWYTPTFHSLHHSKVHTNYCLFMPVYDHLFGTVCPATERTYIEAMSKRNIPQPLATFLAHAGTLTHAFHMPQVSKTIASEPYKERWYLWPFYPLLLLGLVPLLKVCGGTFKNAECLFRKAKGEYVTLEQWGIPRFAYQYLQGPAMQKEIARMVESAVKQADAQGMQVIGLGAFNKAEWLNGGGKEVVKNLPNLRIRVVHGNTLTAATVLHSVPPGTPEVLLVGCTSKVGCAVACILALKGIRVLMVTSSEERFKEVCAQVAAADLEGNASSRLVHCASVADGSSCATWLVGKWISTKDQNHAPKGARLLYFCFPPPQFTRLDVTYLNIGCLQVDPNRVQGLGNCTADLDRMVFHACHVGTIVHALEGWQHHEVGEVDLDAVEVAWEASQRYGFRLTEAVLQALQVPSEGPPSKAVAHGQRSRSAEKVAVATPAPTMTKEQVEQAAREGQPLVVVEGWVHDVGEFLEGHPGGEVILTKYFGRDATTAFNGARYNHSRAARALLAKMRIAKLVTSVPKIRGMEE